MSIGLILKNNNLLSEYKIEQLNKKR